MSDVQPSGTVTLVFTDVEGSTKLLEELGTEGYREALGEHRRVVREAFVSHRGYEVDYEGDAFFYAFASAESAVSAVSEAMVGLETGRIRIRVGIHTGEPALDPPKYVGMDVHRAARIMSTAHGGQVVLSPSTVSVLEPGTFELMDLGEHRLKDIEEAIPIFQLGASSFPPLKTISNTNLPRPASSFVGRETELSEVLTRIEDGARLVTLTGPGGTGKTRLALEAATSLVPEYKAGVFWVGLASLRDAALVTETISQALGAKDGLGEHIAERELLLLLDNLEQVIEAAPELSALLSACPNLTLLVTSRELLRISGEVEYPVPPLAQPEAVSLFCDRAQVKPSEEIAKLCAHLDSLPLAVELAAARAKALSPTQILERLSQRLDLLKGGRDADPRQQTLRSTIEWSYDLLSEKEQHLFARLAVFSGGCTFEAAEEVCDADLDTLQSLVEKSLLRFTNERYWMLETIREFAADRLAGSEEDELERRHAEHFVVLAEVAGLHLREADQAVWLDRLETEHDNIRSVLERSRARNVLEVELKLAANIWRFWKVRGHLAEGLSWLKGVVARGGSQPTQLRAEALCGAADLERMQGDYQSAKNFAELGVHVAREIDDSYRIGVALNTLANISIEEGDLSRAADLLEEAIAALRVANDQRGVAIATNNLGYLALTSGDPDRAAALYEESLDLQRELDHPEGIALALLNFGFASLRQGRPARAAEAYLQSLRLAARLGHREYVAYAEEGLAALAARQGRMDRALRLLASATTWRRVVGAHLDPLEHDVHESTLAAIRAVFPPETIEAASEDAHAMTLDEAVEYALDKS
jgi:predicted ATPase